MKKRFLALALCFSLVLTLLAGCGSKSETPKTDTPKEPKTVSIQIDGAAVPY